MPPFSQSGRLGMQDLTGKLAWVTGAGSGIGEAGAVALAREGASVVLTGRRKGALEAVAERINAGSGGQAHVAAADVSKGAAVRKVASPPAAACVHQRGADQPRPQPVLHRRRASASGAR